MVKTASRWLTWVEPWGPDNEPVFCFAPEESAIAMMKDIRSRQGSVYPNDETALLDFMAVNWARFTEKPKELPNVETKIHQGDPGDEHGN